MCFSNADITLFMKSVRFFDHHYETILKYLQTILEYRLNIWVYIEYRLEIYEYRMVSGQLAPSGKVRYRMDIWIHTGHSSQVLQ